MPFSGQTHKRNQRDLHIMKNKSNYREAPTKLLLLDLDGTVREPKSGKFINTPTNQRIIPGVQERLAKYNLMQWIIIGITNQAGVAYKEPERQQYKTLDDCILEQRITLNRLDQLFKIYFSPDIKGIHVGHVLRNGGGLINIEEKKRQNKVYMDYAFFRKPDIGIWQLIYDDYQVDPKNVLMVGDRLEDRGFANAVGCQFLWADDWRNGACYEEAQD